MTAGWELVVGLEVHVHLKTATKIFCRCSTAFGTEPNANTCPVCLGLPGALPVLNAHAVDLAIRASLALGCKVHERSVFARKNYFYPDLPKGYQISQFERPLATDGALTVDVAGTTSRIGITRVHMEEDAGKLIHDRYQGATAVDLNRAGVPLIEIVSEPDIRSAAEAGAYLRLLKQILEYTDVSDVSMEEGSLRVDANVSACRAGTTTLGTKTELKNLNSFSAVERAIDAEFIRQTAELDGGRSIAQITLLWDDKRSQVRPARAKEESHDYRYFPEPDLPPLVLSAAAIEESRASLPELPVNRRARFESAFGLSATDAGVLTSTRSLGDYYEDVVRESGDARIAANWVMGEVLKTANEAKTDLKSFAVHPPVPPARLGQLIALIRSGSISGSAAKQIFVEIVQRDDDPRVVADRLNLLQVGDASQLGTWLDEVIAENPDEAARFLAGEKRLQGVLVGLVMKKSGGRADPKKLNQLLTERTRS
jgi:aspartyl-tRNA(Asn)/glutamyl-tRNA(Gln) amidotransferase subunit B